MVKSKILITIFTLLITFPAYSFEGYDKYPMQGNTIFSLGEVNIKLSEIRVIMDREEKGIMGGSTKITADHILENLADKEVNFKVAFPIESSCLSNCTEMPRDFKVSINGKPIQTSMSKILSKELEERIERKLSSNNIKLEKQDKKHAETTAKEYEIPLIVWDISLKPKEKKTIICAYTLEWEFSPGTDSATDQFIYNLLPIILWKGKVEKAYFKLILPRRLIDYIKSGKAKISINPKDYYKREDNVIEWFFQNLDFKRIKLRDISVFITYLGAGE